MGYYDYAIIAITLIDVYLNLYHLLIFEYEHVMKLFKNV